eukprot:sb/3463584/
MKGDHVGGLEVWVNHTYGHESVFSKSGNLGDVWNQASVSVGAHRNMNISFVGTIGQSYLSDMAIDDVKLTNCKPTATCADEEFQCSSGDTGCTDSRRVCDFVQDCSDGSDEKDCHGLCGFEEDYCGWVNGTSDPLQLTRAEAWRFSCPNVDHTTGKGGGHYLELATGKEGETASITYPAVGPTRKKCYFSFWYHLEGDDFATINIWNQAGGSKTKVHTVSVDSGKGWNEGGFFLGKVSKASVTLEIVRGKGTKGDVSIDDVGFHRCFTGSEECMADEFTCASGQCIPLSGLCNLVPDCFDGSDEATCPGNCNFEDGSTCGWSLDAAYDDFNWLIGQGPTGSYGTGPDADHTLGTKLGHYLYIEGSYPRVRGDAAWLLSPWYTNPTPKCAMTFWVHMMGQDIGELNVYIMTPTTKDLVRTLSKEQDVVWVKQSIVLPKIDTFRVLLEGVVGDGYESDISIDDISFTDLWSVTLVSIAKITRTRHDVGIVTLSTTCVVTLTERIMHGLGTRRGYDLMDRTARLIQHVNLYYKLKMNVVEVVAVRSAVSKRQAAPS